MTSPSASFAANLLSAGIRQAATLAVALSGGPDSTALAALAAVWHRQQGCGGEPPVALVVDHRLREESGAEAASVAQTARTLGLQPHILQVEWAGGRPRLQDKLAAARAERYALLLEACRRLGRAHLLVAHHADDQAETFLLRLLHASGISGLGCMPLASSALSGGCGVAVVRPLLGARKAQLEGYCRAEGLPYVVDPTNADLSFARNRIRHLLQQQVEQDQGHMHTDERCGGAGIVGDVLRLQRLCARVGAAQQAQASVLLQRALLLSSGVQLPPLPAGIVAGAESCIPAPHRAVNQGAGGPGDLGCAAREWQGGQCAQARSHLGSHLRAVVGRLPAGMAYAICSVPALASANSQGMLATSLSLLLGAVSGQPYAASTRAGEALGLAVRWGRMGRKFTGGGCFVQPIPGSKGQLCIVAPLADQAPVSSALQGTLNLLPSK